MKLHIVKSLVQETYENSSEEWGKWIWSCHVPVVAQKAQELCERFEGKPEFAVAGAWLHDLGDAFVSRFAPDHEGISRTEAEKILQQAEYTPEEIRIVLEEVIEPHSCEPELPTLHEGKIMATADALAHVTTDFYARVCWLHIPQDKNYDEFKEWVQKKVDRDFYKKIFFDEIRAEVRPKYEAIKLVFSTP